MTVFQYHLNGSDYEVALTEFQEGKYTFIINGKPLVARLTFTEENPSCLIKTNPQPPAETRIPVNTNISNPPAAKTSSAPPSPAKSASGSGPAIKSPLPGIVRAIDVKPGDTIKLDQKILVLEAMKMDNSIFADTSGTVVSINCTPGQAVLEGDILIELSN